MYLMAVILTSLTQALRHSKVKLTWDEDDPQRIQLTRRSLSRKEMEENDFKAYLASSGSEDEDEPVQRRNNGTSQSRDKLRALLLGGGDDLPEGWGKGEGGDAGDVDMEITFTPGLSTLKEDREETTLEKYQRKMKEKKKKRKEELKEKTGSEHETEKISAKDEFFADGSEDEDVEAAAQESLDEGPSTKRGKRDKHKKGKDKSGDDSAHARHVSTAEELALLAASDSLNGEPKHFNMKAVLKAEKKQKLKKRRGKKAAEEENELQEEFSLDVKDDRFKAVFEDHSFAIDPSNPRCVPAFLSRSQS